MHALVLVLPRCDNVTKLSHVFKIKSIEKKVTIKDIKANIM